MSTYYTLPELPKIPPARASQWVKRLTDQERRLRHRLVDQLESGDYSVAAATFLRLRTTNDRRFRAIEIESQGRRALAAREIASWRPSR